MSAITGELAHDDYNPAMYELLRTIDDPTQLRAYECDGLTGYRVVPSLVLLPRTAEAVAAAVRVCARAGVPFVAFEVGMGQALDVAALLGEFATEVVPDLAGIARVVVGRR